MLFFCRCTKKLRLLFERHVIVINKISKEMQTLLASNFAAITSFNVLSSDKHIILIQCGLFWTLFIWSLHLSTYHIRHIFWFFHFKVKNCSKGNINKRTFYSYKFKNYVFCFRMTGVGGRPEVIIEGSNNMNSGWKEYEFLYKPGNTSHGLPIVGERSTFGSLFMC